MKDVNYVIVHSKPGIAHPVFTVVAQQWLDEHEDNTHESLMDRLEITDGKIMHKSELPSHSYFPMETWELNDGKPVISKVKAIDHHVVQLKAKRKAKLEELDVAHLIALGKKDDAAMTLIEGKKQALRDFPPTALAELAQMPNLSRIATYLPDAFK